MNWEAWQGSWILLTQFVLFIAVIYHERTLFKFYIVKIIHRSRPHGWCRHFQDWIKFKVSQRFSLCMFLLHKLTYTCLSSSTNLKFWYRTIELSKKFRNNKQFVRWFGGYCHVDIIFGKIDLSDIKENCWIINSIL